MRTEISEALAPYLRQLANGSVGFNPQALRDAADTIALLTSEVARLEAENEALRKELKEAKSGDYFYHY